jgi:hypothetical protein
VATCRYRIAAPASPAYPIAVPSPSVKTAPMGRTRLPGGRLMVPILAAALLASGCSSGDSTVAKTPVVTTRASTPPPKPTGPSTPAPPPTPVDPCAVNNADPAIAKAVSELPRDPRSNQSWNPEPLAGNYNVCAQLSAVIVRANTNSPNPNTRAVMFHLGKFIPSGVPDSFGFNGIDTTASNGDTVALVYSNPVTGLKSEVRFHWNGNAVELIGNTGG